MTHAKKKIDWCLKKAEKELAENRKQRGLVKVNPSKEIADKYILKADHYFEAIEYLKKGGFQTLVCRLLFIACINHSWQLQQSLDMNLETKNALLH